MESKVVYENEFNIDWNRVHNDSIMLSNMISNISSNWKGIISVTRGGLFPALIIAQNLNIHMVDTICVKSYSDKQRQHVNIIKNCINIDNKGDGWIVIDDLVDTGETLQHVKKLYPKALFGVIYAKPKGKYITNLFVCEVPQDIWVVFPWDIKPNVMN